MIASPFRRRVAGLVSALALGVAALPALAQTTSVPAPAPADTATTAAPETAAPQAAPEAAADGAPVAGAPIEPLPDIVLGREDAPVTVIEYASFTCPHCAAFAEENMPKLKADYIDSGKVRFIQRAVYFDSVGLWAGVLAQCDPGKYYPISEALLTTQNAWVGDGGEGTAANLRKIGLQFGMTDAQMDACWNDRARIEQLVATYQINASKDQLQGTPSFIIGGEMVPNQPWDQLKAKIDDKLAQAMPAAATTPVTAPAAEASEPTPAPAEPAATAAAPDAATTPSVPAPATPAVPAPAN